MMDSKAAQELRDQWYDVTIDDAFAAHSRRLLERIKRQAGQAPILEDEAA